MYKNTKTISTKKRIISTYAFKIRATISVNNLYSNRVNSSNDANSKTYVINMYLKY